MPVDKFGRMSDLKTKDTGVSLTYINNNYVRSDGETPLTGSLDMRGNTLYNVADPVNPQDVVTKVYVDNTKGSGVIGRKVGDAVSIKENLDFLGKQKIKKLPDPVNDHDAVTKEYVDTTTVPFLKLDQTKYNTKGDIDMGDQFTVLNVKTPIDDNHITNKKYVDEMDNLKSAFAFKNGSYYAKGGIIMRKNKLGGLREPLQDGEAANKKYVDDKIQNIFLNENDNIAFGLNVDMEGNQILGLPEPATDQEPATKKYVDDLQTQNVDEKGNIKFGRSINLDRNRIFSMKEPTKPSEGANKKYVDDTINKRLQEEKDNFLPQDPATKEYVDEAVKQLAGGDLLVSKEGVFIKANGHYRATAPLDIDNHKMENLPDPVDEKDAVNKKYIDEIVESLTLKQGLLRENGGFNLVDSYINMNFNNIRNVGLPKDEADAVPRSFVENMVKTVEEKRTHLITVHANYCGPLKKGDYPFKFGGNSLKNCNEIIEKHKLLKGLITGFVMPHSGYIRKTICEGLAYINLNTAADDIINSLSENDINSLKLYYRKDDFKNNFIDDLQNRVKFSIFSNKPIQNEKSFFEIVKIDKKFREILKLNSGNAFADIFAAFLDSDLIVARILIEKFDWVQVVASNEKIQGIHEVRLVMQISNNDKTKYIKKGDTINILIPDFPDDLFLEKNVLNDILKPAVMVLFSKLNFNFTFLIELDPL